MCVVQYACMQTAPTDLQWLLPILIFACLIFALFSFSAKYAKIRPPRKNGFTNGSQLLKNKCTYVFLFVFFLISLFNGHPFTVRFLKLCNLMIDVSYAFRLNTIYIKPGVISTALLAEKNKAAFTSSA